MNTIKPLVRALLLLALAVLGQTALAQAATEKRMALLIGNSNYDSAPLSNPGNDVRDMGAALQAAGFETVQKEDLDAEGMKAAIRDFGERMKKDRQAAGFVFFAGHGIQVNGRNFLLPVGRKYKSEQDVENFGLDISFIMRRLEEASGRISVVILDACRNNPFYNPKSRTSVRGLAPMDAPSGSLVAFSTAPGTEASDGSGRNGLFSKHLLYNIRVPGLTLEQVFKRTREGVERESGGRQSPREESSLKGEDFYITPLAATGAAAPVPANAADLAYWETIRLSSSVQDFKAYLKDFAQGSFVSLAQNRIAELSSARAVHARSAVERATLRVGERAPAFSASSIGQAQANLESLSKNPMGVLFFFDKERCKGCLETLARLRALATQYQEAGLVVLAFGKMPQAELHKLGLQESANFQLFSADDELLRQFHISDMLPTMVVTARGGIVTSMVYGGGANNEAVIFALAESMLARGKAVAASQLFNSLRGIQTRMGLADIGNAYSLLKQGKASEAAAVFNAAAADTRRDMEVRGHEGLAEIALAANDLERALGEAEQALRIAPNRTQAHLSRARVLAARGRLPEAEQAIALASSASAVADFAWQTADAATARGNLLRKRAPGIAVAAYQEAAEVNPFAADALANQATLLQGMGEPGRALELLRQAGDRAPTDRAVLALLRQAEQASKQSMDLERQRYIDASVKDLVARFKEQKSKPSARAADDWTSQALALSVLDFQSAGDSELLGKLGMERLLQQEFAQALLSQGITVVDRAILDKLLAELKLGSSELADPDTQLRLGRLMAARLISTGGFTGSGSAKALSLRLLDTETSAIVFSTIRRNSLQDPVAQAEELAAAVAASVRDKYPLKGRIALAEDDASLIINLGSKQGARAGQTFNVLGEGVPVELNGRVIGMREAALGQLELSRCEELMCFARAVEKKGAWAKNQKIILRAGARPGAVN